MALLRTNLGYPGYLGTSAASIYTNTAAVSSYVKGVVLHNTSTSTVTAAVHLVQNSSGSVGTAGLSNRVYQVSLQTLETLLLPFGVDQYPFVMYGTNDTIQAVAGAGSSVVGYVIGDKNN